MNTTNRARNVPTMNVASSECALDTLFFLLYSLSFSLHWWWYSMKWKSNRDDGEKTGRKITTETNTLISGENGSKTCFSCFYAILRSMVAAISGALLPFQFGHHRPHKNAISFLSQSFLLRISHLPPQLLQSLIIERLHEFPHRWCFASIYPSN